MSGTIHSWPFLHRNGKDGSWTALFAHIGSWEHRPVRIPTVEPWEFLQLHERYNARPSKASLLPTPTRTLPPYRLSTYTPALPMDRIRHFSVVCRQQGFPRLEFPLILNHPGPDHLSEYASLLNS